MNLPWAKGQNFDCICKSIDSVNLEFIFDEGKITLREIIPDNFCVLAYHSVYPYMYTLFNGGWIDWVNYDEHVIVNCPHPEGIAMYVKGSFKHPSKNITIEVVQKSSKCFKKYELGEEFYFHFTEENALNFNMLDKIVPYFYDFSKESNEKKELLLQDFTCDHKGKAIHFLVKHSK